MTCSPKRPGRPRWDPDACHLVLIALVLGATARAADALTLDDVLAADWTRLSYAVESSMSEDEPGGTLVVFLHGYGGGLRSSRGFARAIAGDGIRVVLPEAVLPHASGRGAMWWEFLPNDWPKPYPVDPKVKTKPAASRQLPLARRAVVELVERLRARFEPNRTMLVGFSQGAMLALDTAMVLEPPPDRVALLAGYPLLDSLANVEKPRESHPRFLVVHGRQDRVIAFQSGQDATRLLERNGFPVEFVPHDGGHVIDGTVIAALRRFLSADASTEAIQTKGVEGEPP